MVFVWQWKLISKYTGNKADVLTNVKSNFIHWRGLGVHIILYSSETNEVQNKKRHRVGGIDTYVCDGKWTDLKPMKKRNWSLYKTQQESGNFCYEYTDGKVFKNHSTLNFGTDL